MARGSCWVGYEQKGMKKKGNKMVPNCVPAGMKKGGLKEWFRQNWVDIGSKRKDGSYAKCGRSKLEADRKRKYPKCVPAAKAARMTESQRRSAVARKRSKPQGVGGKPTNVKTFAKRQNARSGGLMSPTSDRPNPSMNNMMREAQRNYRGSFIRGNLGGVKVSNPSSVKYYGKKVMP